MTADLYDRATSATASREPISDKGRRKRPAFLALHAEDLDNQFELARYQQSRKEREHLRKSSPTVGENFTFLEAGSDLIDRQAPEQTGRPTRQPTLQNGTMSTGRGQLRPNGRLSPDEDEDDDYDDGGDDNDDDDGEEALEQHLEDPPIPPPPNIEHAGLSASTIDRLSSITEESPQPKKQKSSSSVRSQIIALPETARLRKQASGEQVRQGSDTTTAPSRPTAKAIHNPMRIPSHEVLTRRRQSDLTHRYQSSDPTTIAFRNRRTPSRSASQDARPHPTIPLPPPPVDQYGAVILPKSTSRPMSPASISSTILSPTLITSPGEESWPLSHETSQHPQLNVNHSRTTSEDPSFPALRSLSPDSITPRPSRSGTPLFSNTPYSATPRRGRSRSNTALGQDESPYEQFNDAASIAASSVAPSTMSAQWYRTPRERLGLGGRISTRGEAAPWEQGGDVGDDELLQYEEVQQPQQRSRKVQLFTIYPPKDPTANISGSGPEMHPRSPLLTDKFLTDVHGLPDDLSPQRQQAHPPHLLVGPYGTHDLAHAAAGGVPLHPEGVIPQQIPAHQVVEGLHAQQQSQQSLPNAIPQRTLSLRSLAPRRSGSRAGSHPENESNNVLNKQPSQRSMIGQMAKEYKNLADKWYTGQYEDDEDGEVDEQIRRMREEDAAYENERYGRPPNHIVRPSTSAGIFHPHDTTNRIVKEVTVHQNLSPQDQQNGNLANAILEGGLLRNRPSRDTDSTTTTTTTSSFYTSGATATAGASKGGSTKPPGTSNSSKSGSSGKSKKDKKKDKKKKKPSFWSALREESKALSNTWYQEANAVAEEQERAASRRAGSA
jgi:hypothetical protein